MNKKSKKTLKNAFNIPEPERKDKFFSSLETKQKKNFSFNIPLYISTAVTAVVIMGIWGGVKNLPYFEQPDNIDTPVYSETTSLPYHTENSTIQPTTVSSTKKNTTVSTVAETSGISTVSGTEKTNTTVSVQTMIKTETVLTETTTTAKESNNTKPTTEILTTERTSKQETTTKAIIASRTTIKTTTTTKTTTLPRTTTTTHDLHENISPATTISESEVNCVATTTYIANTGGTVGLVPNRVTTTTYIDGGTVGLVPQTTTTIILDIPPQTMTTTTESLSNGIPSAVDFTVVPAVRYYPNGEIYITDSETNDVTLPSFPGSVNDNEIFRKMAENSDLIAIVEVNEIIYTGFDGKPYTQENVIVKNVIYGDIPLNSRISIYCKGGYIPSSEYSPDKYIDIDELIENNVTVLDYAGNSNFSQEGDVYMCFLKKSDGDFPDGSYYLTGLNNISKFACSGDNFVNHNNHSSLTSGEIQSFFNQ
ncbi:MAG: hypothetical protein K2K66_05455 [Ruminococcus sp.]|nr:hypothetical protein [Ruminococcus sp.]